MERWDPFAPAVRANPYPVYDRWRAADPVHWSRADAWVITRFADVKALLTDARLRHWAEAGRDESAGGAFADLSARWFAVLTPTAKSTLRAGLVRLTGPAGLERLAPAIARRAARLRDAGLRAGGMDLVEEFAEPLALSVAADLLGFDEARHGELAAYVRALPGGVLDVVAGTDEAAARALTRTLHAALSAPVDGTPGLLPVLGAMARDEAASVGEAVAFALLFFFAAHENLAAFLSIAVVALQSQPEQWARLHAPGAIDELLRFDSPLQFMPALVGEDLELDGRRLARGEQVLLALGAANRDPARFAEPHRLDLGRRDVAHVGFGAGPMRCIGASLARLEARIALETLAPCAPRLRLPAAPLAWRSRPAVSRSLARLPVTFDA